MNYQKLFHNKVFEIKDPIYSHNLIIYIGDYDWYQNLTNKKMGIEKIEQKNFGGESFLVEKDGIIKSIIWLPSITFDSSNYSTLTHELLHVAFRVMQNIGFKFDYDNTEPINYLFGHIYGKILLRLIKRTK